MTVPQQADHFLIPLLNGQYALGQVIVVDGTPPDTALCLFTDRMVAKDDATHPVATSEMIALLLVQQTHFAQGTWPITGFETLPNVGAVFNWRAAKKAGFVNLTPHDPAIVEAFINAYHGLIRWDSFGAPDFFNAFLVNPDRTPPSAKRGADG